jgi:hypothetical protein
MLASAGPPHSDKCQRERVYASSPAAQKYDPATRIYASQPIVGNL